MTLRLLRIYSLKVRGLEMKRKIREYSIRGFLRESLDFESYSQYGTMSNYEYASLRAGIEV